MRTTVNIPDDLLMEAKKVTGVKTKTMVLVLGLKELIHAAKLDKLRGLRGKMCLDLDLKSSREK